VRRRTTSGSPKTSWGVASRLIVRAARTARTGSPEPAIRRSVARSSRGGAGWPPDAAGVGKSWEWVTDVEPNVSARYDAVGKPLWSKAQGWHRLEDLGGGRTRIHFRETYHVFNPVLRLLLERRVHRFISKDNDTLMEAAIRAGVAHARQRGSARATQG
jgi:hypothetical protein